ncbi:MAG: SlyX family protein [Halioglobus sp.]|nr:SlyX family protein [Halioglobus sp.]
MSDEITELRELVEHLQSQLAFQEDAVASLDAALAAQQKDILLLGRQIALLHERQTQFAGQTGADASQAPSLQDEKPPHY